MLDTNAVSDLVRNPLGGVAAHYRDVGPGSVCISIIVASELRFGIAKFGPTRFWRRIADVLMNVPIAPYTAPADHIYAQVRAYLVRNGTPIGPNDLFIAAHALALDLTLVTANEREFRRVPGLKVENWLALAD